MENLFTAGKSVSLVVPTQVIEHPKGLVVFDTGFADDVADGGCEAYFGKGLCDFLSPNWTRENVIDRQLKKLGHAVDEVKYVVYSHFHLDHVGNLEMFPRATHVVQLAEIRHAWWPERYDRGGFVLKDFDEGRDFTYMELAGDFDLFGDGCVQIISTPGHTVGHQSLVVRLPKTGQVILTGDAIYSPRHLEGVAPGISQNLVQSAASIARIKGIRDAHGARIWITHDVEQYKARRQGHPYE
jgi:glyoxylase-like metal-dependent hydrolase (beta-lactamase superfamily II)